MKGHGDFPVRNCRCQVLAFGKTANKTGLQKERQQYDL